MGQFEAVFDGDSSSFNGEKCTQHLYTNCSFACSDFLMYYYIVRMKSIYKSCIRTTENSKITALQLHYCSFPFNLMTFARNRKSDILTLTPFYLPWSLSLKLNSLSICTSNYIHLKTSRGINSKDNYK